MRLRRTAAVLLATLTTASAVALAPAGATAPARADDDRAASRGPEAAAAVRLEGRGYGHGRGLSQYGAQGAASVHGRTHRQILRHYYPGLDRGAARGKIAVLVTAATSSDLVVSARAGLTVARVGAGPRYRLDRGGADRWRVVPVSGGRSRVDARVEGRWRRERVLDGDVRLTAGGKPLRLHLPGGATARYRGALRSATPASGQGRDTVNVVGLEDYLRGVVPREVPALWHPEAVRAQAVAARTYAAFERAEPDARHYQTCDTSQCQVYGGADAEHPASDDAVRATAHQVLVTGNGRPAFTQFSASNGGWSVDGGRPYLPARQDPWDRFSGNPNRSWSLTLTDAALERAYPAIGSFRSLRVTRRDGHGAWGGRALTVRVVGSRSRVSTSGESFRFALGLRSSWFRVR